MSLSAKKKKIAALARRNKNVVRTILHYPDIYDQFVLSLTYNTNRIEGSTLTEPETAAILFENAALPNKTIIEQMEVKNHQAALLALFRRVQEGKKIDEGFILTLHGMLMNGIREDAGRYRSHGVRIVGAYVPTANYLKIPELMKSLSREISARRKDVVAHAAQIHSRFEQIHPFSDGNGRVGRLILGGMLLAADKPPAIILQEKRRLYLSTLNQSQTQGEFGPWEDFLSDAVIDAYALLQR